MPTYNPFNPNSVVTPTLFAGRAEQINEIFKKLTQLKHKMPSSFFIYGERGIGKTAIAKLVRFVATSQDKDLHDLNLLTSYYAVEEGQTVGSVLQESLNKLSDQMSPDIIATVGKRIGELFKNGKFQIGAFGASLSTEFDTQREREISIKDQVVSILTNIIKSLDEQAESSAKDGILIIIDEIHNLENIPALASIIRNIVTSLDVEDMGRVAFLLVGYEEDVTNFFSQDSSARRTFDLVPVNVMPHADAVDLLKKGFKAAGITWDESALEENIRVAGGYPHSLQIIGHNLVELDTDGKISQDDWSKAITRSAIELQKKEFSSMYKFDKPLTQSDQILAALAKKNMPMSRKEISSETGIQNVYQHFKGLKEIGAIKETDDKEIYLHSQLFRTAILVDLYIREAVEEKVAELIKKRAEK